LGLDDTLIKSEYIENALFERGQALFFNDKQYGLMCLPCSPEGGFNAYGIPQKFRASGMNGYHKSYSLDNSVWIKNTPLVLPTHDAIMMYTQKLTEVERTLDTNVMALKTPYIVKCDDISLLTAKNIMNSITGNETVVYVDKNGINTFEVLQTGVQSFLAELADYRHDVTNEVLTFLGINNANTDKKERLITDEVNSNNDFVSRNAEYMLKCRKDACEEINAMFGLSLSVRLKQTEQQAEPEEKEEGEIDG
jgi:hypothetical protein